MVAYMDKMVGRVVAKTEALGIADNTLIFFTGDNGTNTAIKSQLNGVEIIGGKGKTTDAGTLVPLVALWQGVTPKGRVCEDLVDFSDLLPTCLEAAQLAVPCGLDGQSFLPQLRGETGTPREWLHCYYCPRPERTPPKQYVRDKRWKLYDDGSFFDAANDVLEERPLADDGLDAEALAAKRRLQKALASMPAEGESLLKFVPNGR
jgi:arylsulfatase A